MKLIFKNDGPEKRKNALRLVTKDIHPLPFVSNTQVEFVATPLEQFSQNELGRFAFEKLTLKRPPVLKPTSVDEIKAASWCKLDQLHQSRYFCGTAIIHEKLYIIGGIQGSTKWKDVTNKVECFDIETKRIDGSATSTLNRERHYPGVAVHQGKIYVVGGAGRNARSRDTVEVWDGRSWKLLDAKMNTARYAMAVVVHNDHLYAIGGRFSEYGKTFRALKTCECLDLTEIESKQR